MYDMRHLERKKQQQLVIRHRLIEGIGRMKIIYYKHTTDHHLEGRSPSAATPASDWVELAEFAPVRAPCATARRARSTAAVASLLEREGTRPWNIPLPGFPAPLPPTCSAILQTEQTRNNILQ